MRLRTPKVTGLARRLARTMQSKARDFRVKQSCRLVKLPASEWIPLTRTARTGPWQRIAHRAAITRAQTEKDNNVGPAFAALCNVVEAAEYDRIVREWKQGDREIRMENGFVAMCYTPPK